MARARSAITCAYFKTVCAEPTRTTSVYPYVFPHPQPGPAAGGAARSARDTTASTRSRRSAGTPTWRRAARVDCALTGAGRTAGGAALAYALVRPPGHHAERGFFGGFCYFNNAAIAAHYLSRFGRVAMLDIDYHHGNGQQDIFYRAARTC